MKLIAADIDGIDAAGPARDEHLRKATGRGADVEADAAADLEREGIERRRELDAPARHVGVLRRRLDRSANRDRLRGLAYDEPVGNHAAGRDRGLRPRAALEQSALDQKASARCGGWSRRRLIFSACGAMLQTMRRRPQAHAGLECGEVVPDIGRARLVGVSQRAAMAGRSAWIIIRVIGEAEIFDRSARRARRSSRPSAQLASTLADQPRRAVAA